ncbi:AAA family ATPase [Paraburkholderia hayleyella]|uniref:AAA family ATPase n=1 Tax=Paraburkholderia hayleyella TaxID=2152889 RepID=UPI001291026E|nr:ATP-binding protein [Paraburkholderia hayleyella]
MSLVLRKISIREFKQFDGEFIVDSLQPGLNLFTGQNEAGKSTFADAIRTCFLERYKSKTLDILPHDRPYAAPRIDIEFAIEGQTMALSKQFVKTPRCELRMGALTLSGDEAEERLAEILGFGRQKRGALGSEHAGIPGLLWVRQGDADKIGESSGHAAGYLREAVAQLSGSHLSRGEDTLIAAVEAELFKLVTEKRRQPANQLLEANNALAELEAQRETLASQWRDFEAQLAMLTSQQAAYDETERKKPWDALEAQANEAQARADAAAQLQAKLGQAEQAWKHAELELSVLLQKENGAAQSESTLARLKQQLHEAMATLEEADRAYQQTSAALLQASASQQAASQALERANLAANAAELRNNIALHQAETQRLAAAMAQAETANANVLATERELARVEIDSDKLKRLKGVVDDLWQLRAKKDAAQARIEYRLSQAVAMNGVELNGSGSLALDSEKHFALPGLGEVIFKPGNASLPEVFAALEAREAEQRQLLQALSINTYADGEARDEAMKRLRAQRAAQKELLTSYAPEGLEDLRMRQAQAITGVQEAQRRLEALPDTTGALDGGTAKHAAETALARLNEIRLAQTAAAEKRSSGRATAESLRETLTTHEARLADPAFIAERAATLSAILEKQAVLSALEQQIRTVRAEAEAARADDWLAEAQRLRKSIALAREEHQERAHHLIKLRVRLETVGASGLGEQLAVAEASLEQAMRRKQELQAKADALSLLERLLNEERAASVRALHAPLMQRLEHYLRFVFPQARLSLSDDLGPVALTRDERSHRLEALSGGTREQIGVLARLAYADMLGDSGRPTLLLFDDITVNSDNTRLAGIKRAILDAANRHQILLMTHEAL